jgi:hypothetical protein
MSEAPGAAIQDMIWGIGERKQGSLDFGGGPTYLEYRRCFFEIFFPSVFSFPCKRILREYAAA